MKYSLLLSSEYGYLYSKKSCNDTLEILMHMKAINKQIYISYIIVPLIHQNYYSTINILAYTIQNNKLIILI